MADTQLDGDDFLRQLQDVRVQKDAEIATLREQLEAAKAEILQFDDWMKRDTVLSTIVAERDQARAELAECKRLLSEAAKAVFHVSGPSHPLALQISEFLARGTP